MLPRGIELKSKRNNPLRLAPLSGLTSISGSVPKFEPGLLARMKESSEGMDPRGNPIKHSDGPGVGVEITVGVMVGELVMVGVGVCVLVVVVVGVNVGVIV